MRKLFVCAFAVGLICGAAMADESEWISDFVKAKSAAVERKVPIFALFTGSDWCPWCKKLESEILKSDEFKNYAKDNLALFVADFPRSIQQPRELAEQNQELAMKYGVEGFPTVVLLNGEDGKEIARTGYRAIDAKAYVEHIRKLLKK